MTQVVADTLNPAHSGNCIRFVIFINCVATMGGFLFGLGLGAINGAVDGLLQAFRSGAGAATLLAGVGLATACGLYAAAAAISAYFVLRFLHETRGRKLELMEVGADASA